MFFPLQVDRFGRLATVHVNTTENEVMLDQGSVFHVYWSNEAFPTAADNCGGADASCSVHGQTCLCDIEVVATTVFSNASGNASVPSADAVRNQLKSITLTHSF